MATLEFLHTLTSYLIILELSSNEILVIAACFSKLLIHHIFCSILWYNIDTLTQMHIAQALLSIMLSLISISLKENGLSIQHMLLPSIRIYIHILTQKEHAQEL